MRRIAWIDFVRAVGIIMIIMVHSLAGEYSESYLDKLLFAVNVPVFFVLSGYLYKEKKVIMVIKSGFFNLLLPYFFSVLVIAAVEQLYQIFPSWINEFSSSDFMKAAFYGLGTPTLLPNNVTIPAIGAIWFLLAMFCGNILFTLAIKISKKSNKKYTLEFLVLVMIVIGFWSGTYIKFPWSLNAALVSQCFYYVGYMIKKYQLIEENGNLSLTCIGLIFWLLSAQSGFFYLNVPSADNILLALLGGVGGSYFLMSFAKSITKNTSTRCIDYYGRMSLIVLSVHLVEMNSLKVSGAITNYVFLHTHSNLAVTYGVTVYRILVTIVMILIIPKVPIIRSFFLNRQYPFFKKKQEL